MENEEDRKQKKTEKTPSHARWGIRVFLIAVALSAAMSLCSGALLEVAGYVVATLILLLFIALCILIDIIGVAVTAANPKPFNSMAAHRVKGAKEALYLIRNAEKVASFCNDVVGAICGNVSGSPATVNLELAFTLAKARPDAAARLLLGKMAPHATQTRQQILKLHQLHL